MILNDLPMISFVFQENVYVWNSDKIVDYVPTYLGGYNYLTMEVHD